MGKVFISILVFGMASLASAKLMFVVPDAVDNGDGSFTVSVGDTFDVVLANDKIALPVIPASLCFVGVDITHAVIGGPAVIYDLNIPGEWIIEERGYDPEPIFWWDIINTIPCIGGINANIDLVRVTLHCVSEGDVVVGLYDSSCEEQALAVTIHQIPEPAALTLLAAGGLILRYRRIG